MTNFDETLPELQSEHWSLSVTAPLQVSAAPVPAWFAGSVAAVVP